MRVPPEPPVFSASGGMHTRESQKLVGPKARAGANPVSPTNSPAVAGVVSPCGEKAITQPREDWVSGATPDRGTLFLAW